MSEQKDKLREKIAKLTDDALASLTAILIRLGVSNIGDVEKANPFTQEAIYSLREKTINQIIALIEPLIEDIEAKAKLTVQTELALERDTIKQLNEAKIEDAKKQEQVRHLASLRLAIKQERERIIREVEEHCHSFDKHGNPLLHTDFRDSTGNQRLVNWWQALRKE